MRSAAILVSGVIWLCVCCAGFWQMFKYESTPGARASQINTHLPKSASNGKASIIVFVHPQCPCTRTTIDELAQLMDECDGKISASVYFFKPHSFAKDWEKTDLWHSASAIHGARVFTDEDGEVARKFGAMTSGQVFVFDEKGNEVFNGGITAGRGHAGENAGRSAIVTWVNSKSRVLSKTPVFGCSLTGPTAGDRGNAN